MKKIFIISFLIFTMLLCCFNTTYAAITVTEESLQKSFDKYATSSENKETSASMEIDKTNKVITLTSEEDSYTMNYDLSGKPTFSIDLSFNKSMTKEDWETEASKPSLLMTIFVLIADLEEIDFTDSMTYIMSSAFKNLTSDQPTDTSNITNAIEYAKLTYDKENPIKDTLFTLTTKKISETNDEYKAQATLVVNNDADFSIINGSTDELMQNISNSINQSVTNMVEQQEKVNKVTNSLNKLPQTGNFFNLRDSLVIICIISSIFLLIIALKDIKYKNIINK